MAYGNWDAVLKDYMEFKLKGSRYDEHVKNMIEFVPQIRILAELGHIIPGTSHLALFMQLPSKLTTVNVWYSGNNEYIISMSNPSQRDFAHIYVPPNKVVEVIKEYVKKLDDLA